MPTFDHKCEAGHIFERVLRFAELDQPQHCECGALASRVILRAPMGYVQPNICYDSPVDGRPITSKHARLEDLKRHGCVEYDPGMRQDFDRRVKDNEVALDRSIEQTVEASVAQMPSRQREKLETELRSGVNAETVRGTVDGKGIAVSLTQ